MTNVRQSSIDAYRDMDLTGRQLEVLEVLVRQGPSTIREFAAAIGVVPSSVTGALASLKKRDVVHMGARRTDRITGNNNHEWCLGAEPQEEATAPQWRFAEQASLLGGVS